MTQRDELINKMVTITSGPFRGQSGRVIEITNNRNARIEL
jgi:transcription elongation factor